MDRKTIKDIDVKNKNILVRVDYNVDFDDDGQPLDDGGIINTRETVNYLTDQNARVFLISHLGRPQGKQDETLSLKKLLPYLEEIFQKKVNFSSNYLQVKEQKKLRGLPAGSIVLLENIRFFPGEKKNDPELAKKLAKLADIYVNDCFGASHRKHVSIVGLAEYLPAVAGLLLAKEVDLITQLISKPVRPFIFIVGGVKIATRLRPINRLVKVADSILVGGDLADHLESRTDLVLPEDVVAGNRQTRERIGVFAFGQVPKEAEQLDIGPKTRKKFTHIISKAKTIIWNGPVGMIENEQYRRGTEAIFQAIINNSQATSLVGGGDTLAFLRGKKGVGKITHRSTGGGAMLKMIEQGSLSGIKVLDKKESK
jgi:phosphoglycerate kinase